jgi:hypothetical protein
MLANRAEDLAFWRALESFDPGRLSSAARRWAGERWAEQAQMEHASIASFAKFSLQLVMVAAPPALLADAHHAAVDEIHHARIAFALASRLLGQPLGPGAVDLAGDVVGERTLAAVARETMRDGCVGETVAAAEALEAGKRALDPAIAHAMSCVLRDEQRHAELAWRFAAWAAEVGGAPVRKVLREAFEAAVAASTPPTDPAAPHHPGLGHLSAEEKAQVRAVTIEETLWPAMRALDRG